ncbi:zinc knuckle family protein [Perilla frutescens var. hirtella]|nr:zinc knuckle family protein [Perilla frutescens var. hirtella]
MEEDGGGGFRPGKKSAEKGGEVDYKTKAGTAWSHSFLNQKPWHPLSYPNQRRKWIAEQTHSQNQRRAEEVAREYAQQQDFLRQAALLSKKEKEKLEMMQAVSFLYVKPPGYNAESAKAAEIADEKKKLEQSLDEGSSSMKMENGPSIGEKKKPASKDVFGRALPTEEQFEVLKNAPKLDTGVAGRAKPFGVEIRNVKCLRCGNYGHQSGDRECPLKDAIMPNEESRLKRDDPLTAIQAQVESSEPLKWELKQKPGMSPPHGGFDLDDPNQQIVADDIFDEYGGFLGEASIPELLTNFSSSKIRKKKKSDKSKHARRSPSPVKETRDVEGSESSSGEEGRRKIKKRHKQKKQKHSVSSPSESSDSDRPRRRRSRHKHRHSGSSEASDSDDRGSRRHHHHHHSHRHRHRHQHQR